MRLVKPKMSTKFRLLIILVCGLVLSLLTFFLFNAPEHIPLGRDYPLPLSTDIVRVHTSSQGWLICSPVKQMAYRGLLWLAPPDVDLALYANIGMVLAAQGVQVIIAPSPQQIFNKSSDYTKQITRYFSDISLWAVGGHDASVFVAIDAQNQTSLFDGLIALIDQSQVRDQIRLKPSALRCLLIGAAGEQSQINFLAWQTRLPPRTLLYQARQGTMPEILMSNWQQELEGRLIGEQLVFFMSLL